jgi:PadR family transcriptional regulator PadR
MVRVATKNDLMPGTLEMLILHTLTHRQLHGYGIAQHIQQISYEVLQVEEGSLYPALQRLLVKGWVQAEWGTSENNRRARYYKLTPAGRKQVGVEAENFSRMVKAIARVMQTT